MTDSARYTYISTDWNISVLLDKINEFTTKYPEYRLFQILLTKPTIVAILTTDPLAEPK